MGRPHVHAIIPAAGTGSRLGGADEPPKQYRELLGRPMLQWALERVCDHPGVAGVTVALAPGDSTFATLPLSLACPLYQVDGGDSRARSVLNAVHHARREAGAEWALVHDAARPCLDRTALDRLLEAGLAHEHGALLAMPVADTLKRAAGDPPVVAATVDRDGLWAAQTPQLFPAAALEQALEEQLAAGAAPTDEAGAMEAMGWRPRLVTGSAANLKVTWPGDEHLAETLLRGAAVSS